MALFWSFCFLLFNSFFWKVCKYHLSLCACWWSMDLRAKLPEIPYSPTPIQTQSWSLPNLMHSSPLQEWNQWAWLSIDTYVEPKVQDPSQHSPSILHPQRQLIGENKRSTSRNSHCSNLAASYGLLEHEILFEFSIFKPLYTSNSFNIQVFVL